MKKWKLIPIMLLFMIGIVSAIDECPKIATQSDAEECIVTSTWNYTPPCNAINTTVYNSSGNNIINYTFIDFGDSNLCYFVWNISTLGSYNYVVTNGDTGNILVVEDETMSLALIIGVGIISALFLFFAFNLKEDHFILKMLLIFFALISLIMIPAGLVNGVEATATTLLKVVLGMFGLFIIYFSVYLFWHWVKRSEKFADFMSKIK